MLLAASNVHSATFATLSEGASIAGFKAVSLYLDDADRPFGARFRHEKTGFTLDLIQLQSVPQAFTYVNTYPTSDKGEPHTQEHLLVGKGNKGRLLAESEGMTLTGFTAFTMQWRTCYPFNTKAGPPVFYQQFERLLDALLHPDYSDEEIRREVRNFGIADDPATHKLRLEEKGSVYNEMTSSTRQQGSVLFRSVFRTIYGGNHPLAYNSGGEPSGIREMLPEDIRKFHREHYFLANMGSIVSLPKSEELEPALARVDQILNRLQPAPVAFQVQTEATLPAFAPAPAGQIAIKDYPFENEKQPSFVVLAWPATRNLNPREHLLMDLFMDNMATDATSNLYRLLVNSRTRKVDLGASGVFNQLSTDKGHFAMFGVSQVAVDNITEAKIAEVRQMVMEELDRVASWSDGSPELLDFNMRLQNRIISARRQLGKLGNSPPGFGFRNGNAFWMQQLDTLNKEPGFRKSLTMKSDYAAIDAMLSTGKNIWKANLSTWQLTGVTPYALGVRPNAALIKQEADERMARASAEGKRLAQQYGVADEQDALTRYKKEYDAKTAELNQLASASSLKFIDNPPLTLDDQLDYRVGKLAGGVPLVASTFDNMTSATAGLALRLDGTPESELFLLSLLPSLLTQTGVIVNGKPVTYEEMREKLRKEVLALNAGFASDLASNRVELVLEGAGNDLAESRRAVEWMQLCIQHPNWTIANLSRIRDLVDQSLSGLRSAMQGPEERWVRNPFDAYRKQTNPLYLTAESLLTKTHNVDRLRWMLKDSGLAEDRASISTFLSALAAAGSTNDRAALKALLTAIPNGAPAGYPDLTAHAKTLAIDVVNDLAQMLPDLPDATLKSDWSYLCSRIREDLAVGPEKTLARLDALRANTLNAGNARMWVVGSQANQQKLESDLQTLAGALRQVSRNVIAYPLTRRVDQRLREHQGDNAAPRFVGLLNANMQGGVFETAVPATTYRDTGRENLLRYLAYGLYAGGGAHSVFTKTIGAGLAYSNGLGQSLRDGITGYYAERMPDVTQTVHFVIDTIRNGPRDAHLSEYVIAGAFGASNAASSYEARARAIADDLADGITPDVVKRYREGILALRKDPQLASELFARIDKVYGPTVPGFGPKAKDVPGAVYYLIGNEKQFKSLDADVQAREDEHVYKLYPRDYWLTQ